MLLIGVIPGQASVSFNVTYEDVTLGTGQGFDDPTFGAARRQVVEDVTSYLSGIFDHTATVDLKWNSSDTDGSGPLASFGTSFYQNAGIHGGLVRDNILNGTNNNGNDPDGSGFVDFGYDYYLGAGTPGASQYDLQSVVLHEITHSLGFLSLIDSDGSPRIQGTYSVFDTMLYRIDSGRSLNQQLVDESGNFTGSAADLTSGEVYFTGTEAVAAMAGDVPIYAPSTFVAGSSLGHIDMAVEAVMNPAIASGEVMRFYTDVERAMFSDLGYSVVPEPISMTLSGLALVAWVAYRRRRRLTRAG